MNELRPAADGLTSLRLLRALIAYCGGLQAMHLLLIAWAGGRFVLRGELGFPAMPPATGWSADMIPWLIGNGIFDLLFAAAGVLFCVRFFQKRKGWLRWGLVSSSGALYSAGIFGIGTIPSGAWGAHPVPYLLLAVAFAPILPCLVLLLSLDVEREA